MKHTEGKWVYEVTASYCNDPTSITIREKKEKNKFSAMPIAKIHVFSPKQAQSKDERDSLSKAINELSRPLKEAEANARLIAAAPETVQQRDDQLIVLELMTLDLARIKTSQTIKGFSEFVFNGLRYTCHDRNWSEILEIIGRDNAKAAIAKCKVKE